MTPATEDEIRAAWRSLGNRKFATLLRMRQGASFDVMVRREGLRPLILPGQNPDRRPVAVEISFVMIVGDWPPTKLTIWRVEGNGVIVDAGVDGVEQMKTTIMLVWVLIGGQYGPDVFTTKAGCEAVAAARPAVVTHCFRSRVWEQYNDGLFYRLRITR